MSCFSVFHAYIPSLFHWQWAYDNEIRVTHANSNTIITVTHSDRILGVRNQCFQLKKKKKKFIKLIGWLQVLCWQPELCAKVFILTLSWLKGICLEALMLARSHADGVQTCPARSCHIFQKATAKCHWEPKMHEQEQGGIKTLFRAHTEAFTTVLFLVQKLETLSQTS